MCKLVEVTQFLKRPKDPQLTGTSEIWNTTCHFNTQLPKNLLGHEYTKRSLPNECMPLLGIQG